MALTSSWTRWRSACGFYHECRSTATCWRRSLTTYAGNASITDLKSGFHDVERTVSPRLSRPLIHGDLLQTELDHLRRQLGLECERDCSASRGRSF